MIKIRVKYFRKIDDNLNKVHFPLPDFQPIVVNDFHFDRFCIQISNHMFQFSIALCCFAACSFPLQLLTIWLGCPKYFLFICHHPYHSFLAQFRSPLLPYLFCFSPSIRTFMGSSVSFRLPLFCFNQCFSWINVQHVHPSLLSEGPMFRNFRVVAEERDSKEMTHAHSRRSGWKWDSSLQSISLCSWRGLLRHWQYKRHNQPLDIEECGDLYAIWTVLL